MQSLLKKKWIIRSNQPDLDFFDNLLYHRGIRSADDSNSYLFPNFKKGFHNPFLMKDMDKAVERINRAIADKERIIIFGDYDVDGISGTAVMVQALTLMGANVSYRLPHRLLDGYGLAMKFIEEFREKDIKLLITVDCGISCKEQIEKAHEYGIDTIITDHHTVPEQIPDKAYAILHPLQKDCPYPFKGLTGSGVAYKLASALITNKFPAEEKERLLFSLLDLASLGTVADMGPLLDENRIIVKYGLEALQNTNWQGLRYLMEQAGFDFLKKMDTTSIGFKIGPRINAAGRIDSPYYALQLLLHDGDEQRGKALAAKLEELNITRQKMVVIALEEAEIMYKTQAPNAKIFIAWSKDWHVGILGLIASKFVEKYGIPCAALQEFDEHLVASFRSNEYLNAFDALNATKEYLSHFGGHAQAAGFSLKKENLPAFVKAINDYTDHKLREQTLESELMLDAEIADDQINEQLVNMLGQLQPFGIGNQEPLFLMRNVRAQGLKKVGKDESHLHFFAKTPHGSFPVIAFKFGSHADFFQQTQSMDLACHLEKNEWNGRTSIKLRVIDARKSE